MFPTSNRDAGLLESVRAALVSAGYTTQAVGARRAEAASHGRPRTGSPGPASAPVPGLAPADALDVLIALFLEPRALPREEAAGLLPAGLLDAFERLELVGAAVGEPDQVRAEVALYPAHGLYVVSDLDAESSEGRTDSVFPVSESDVVYLSSFPRTPCRHFLELCSGTGIGALVAAPRAERAWAVDLTERSTAFARFNAALNGIENVVPLQGDLYEPVEGLKFDRIVAHPPYVPSLRQNRIYRDAGADGEEVTRGILAGARAHLAPGGQLYCTCVASEREGEALEQRFRAMLGPDSDDCDVLVFASTGTILFPFVAEAAQGRLPMEEFGRLLLTFRELKIRQFVACTVVVERHSHARPAITVRRKRGDGELATSLDAIVRWELYPESDDGLRRLLAVRPGLAEGVRLQATHLPHDGAWQFVGAHVVTDSPVPAVIETSPAAAAFLARCDGGRTVREHLGRMVDEGQAPADAPTESLTRLVLGLLREGVLRADAPG